MLTSVFESRDTTTYSPVHPRDPALAVLFGGAMDVSTSGQPVTPDSAMRVTAVWACVTLIAGTIGALGVELTRKLPGGGKKPAEKDYRYSLLRNAPNADQTAPEFFETLVLMRLLRGRGCAQIITDRKGIITALVPLPPDRVEAFRAPDKSIAYAVRDDKGVEHVLLSGEVLDYRGPSLDGGVTCLSPIRYGVEAIGSAQSANVYTGKFFEQGAIVSGVLEVPADQTLSEPAYERLSKFKARYSGVSRGHQVPILEGGVKFTPITINPEDAQLLETRKFSVRDIARLYHAPPHKIGDLEGSSFSNIEQQNLDWVTDGLLPEVVKLEAAIERAIFTLPADGKLNVSVNLNTLMRGDSAARSNYYRALWGVGSLSSNDIRVSEGRNPIPDGDKYYIPVNMTPIDQPVGKTIPEPGSDQPAPTPGDPTNGG